MGRCSFTVSLTMVVVMACLPTFVAAQPCGDPPDPWSTFEQYAAVCQKYGGHISNQVCVGWDTNWCHRGDASAGVSRALVGGAYSWGFALGRWLTTPNKNDENAAAQKEFFLRELERQHAEAERQHKIAEARRLQAIYDRLTATMKLTGLPELHLKGIDASGGLQLKLGDQSQAYGIPGLPGVYTNGPRDANSLPDSGGLKLKIGTSEVAATNRGNTSSTGGEGIPGLPGVYTDGPGGTPDFKRLTPEQVTELARVIGSLPPDVQDKLMEGTRGGATLNAPGGSSSTTPQSDNALQGSQLAPTQSLAGSQLQHVAETSQAAANAVTPEQASVMARTGFDQASGTGRSPGLATQPASQSTAVSGALPVESPRPAPGDTGGASLGMTSDGLSLKSGSPHTTNESASSSAGFKGIETSGENDVAAKDCAQRATAAASYSDLKQRVATDQQEIRNFGFAQRADELQAWGTLSEAARTAYEKKARDILVDVALANIVGGIKAGVAAAPFMSQELSTRLVKMFAAAGLPNDDVAYRIARKVGETITPEQAEILVGRIAKVKDVYDGINDVAGVARAQDALELARSVVAVAGWRSPAFALLAKDLDTLSLGVYATEYARAKHQVTELTRLTEDQLKDLNDFTTRLRSDTAQLRAVVMALQSLPPCDSTGLVRK